MFHADNSLQTVSLLNITKHSLSKITSNSTSSVVYYLGIGKLPQTDWPQFNFGILTLQQTLRQ